MTVRELREKLSEVDDKTKVVVYAEDEATNRLFEIDEVSICTGTPGRDQAGKAGFSFGKDGPASWLFIAVTAA